MKMNFIAAFFAVVLSAFGAELPNTQWIYKTVGGKELKMDVFLIAVCIYYVVSSWRKLHGAQWCIVAGLLISVVFLIGLIMLSVATQSNKPSDLAFFLLTGFLLSFPLASIGPVARE